MTIAWEENLAKNQHAVQENAGPRLAAIVSGSQADRDYWEKRFLQTRSEVFRRDEATHILSVHEKMPRGNFLGTLCVWDELQQPDSPLAGEAADENGYPAGVALISMLFGKGTRLSPFTQALGNCKPRFPTPYCTADGLYLSIGELSTLYSNLLIRHLESSGFHGMVVKWGDEIVLPGASWQAADYSNVDALRFAWFTQPTAELAREKEWLLADNADQRMIFQLVRQDQAALLERADRKRDKRDCRLGVNLGSLAIRYEFLDIARQVLAAELFDPKKRVDWDPYIWLALACQDEAEWHEEVAYERSQGIQSIVQLEEQFPDFYPKVARVRHLFEQQMGRPFTVKVLDYGDVFWTDFGQHLALRQNLAVLLEDTPHGHLTRALFRLPQERDQHGNTLINAHIHPEARLRNSLVVNSTIRSADSVVENGILVGCDLGQVSMSQGGIALFCTARTLTYGGANAIALNAMTPELQLPEGGRHATVTTNRGQYQLYTNEAITDYKGQNYTSPLPGNALSFDEASALVETSDEAEVARVRQEAAAVLSQMLNLSSPAVSG